LYSRIDVHLWVIDQCHAKPWGPCISTKSYCPKVYLWSSEAYWRELPCARGSERPRSAVPEISADQCPALINWYLDEYWLLWHVFGHRSKGLLEGFPTHLGSWESCKYLWSYGRMKFVIQVPIALLTTALILGLHYHFTGKIPTLIVSLGVRRCSSVCTSHNGLAAQSW